MGGDVFVGRAEILAAFEQQLQRAAAGRGSVTLIRGEAGLGKSRLLRAFAELAGRQGFQVGFASNFEYARSPFAPLFEGLRGLLEGHDEVLPRAKADRSAILGLMGSTDVDPPTTLDKRRLFVIIAEMLQRLAQRTPWVLLIDDAQWADPESLEFVAYLAPRLSGSPGVIVVSQRYGAGDDATLIDLPTRVANLERFDVPPLSRTEARLLIAALRPASSRLSQKVVDDITARAEGNPLYIEELMRGIIHAPLGKSATIQNATLAKLDRLSRRNRTLIESASVIGRRFDVESLTIICDTDEESVLAAVRAARDEHLIEELGDEAKAFVFRHELVRRAVYDRLLAAQRQAIHRRIAARFEAQPQPSHELVAAHRLAAGDLLQGALAAEGAGDEAMSVDAVASARDRYLEAEATRVFSGADLARLEEKLGRAFDLLGDPQSAADRFESAATFFAQHGSHERAAALRLRLAVMRYRSRHTNEALEFARSVLAAAPSGATEFAAHSLLAMILAFEDQSDAAQRHVADADRMTDHGDPNSRIALDYAKIALARFSRGDGWVDPARAVVEHAAETGDLSLLAHALINFGIVACERGRPSEGIEALQRAVEIADKNGRIFASAHARIALIDAFTFAGKLHEAYHVILAAGALHVDALEFRLNLAAYSLPILCELGRLEMFPQFLDESLLDEARAADDERSYAPIVAAQLYAAASLGRPYPDERVDEALTSMTSPSNLDPALLWFARFASPKHLPRIDELTRTPFAYSEQNHIYRTAAQAVIHQRERSKNRAVIASQAVEAAREGKALMVEALVLEMSGRVHEARPLYEACGASTSIARLRDLANSALTPREREIAILAAAGKSNREIANLLVLSERTAEHHVSAILRKLGLTRRDDLAKRLDDSVVQQY